MQEHLSPGSVNVVVTSPPYNLGIRYSHYDDTISRQAYLQWLGEWARVVREILHDDGSLFLNVGSKPTDPNVPFQVLQVVQQHLRLQNTLHWIKSIAIEKENVGDYPGITQDVSVGHFKPINSPRFVNDQHEYIFHLTKRGDVKLDRLAIGVPYQDKSNVTRWASAKNDLRCRGNTWFIPYETIKSRANDRPHPATFPVQLAEMCIKLHGVAKTALVLDPFLGIGQSALAALKLEKDFVGFEIDRAYFDEAVKRVRAAC
ncbi:MAG: site-specific DNA-methyltransferase [Chloroflexi bacterium]|nr:site-specific DNA-methyltransferase [Chloroflexota bacterium]